MMLPSRCPFPLALPPASLAAETTIKVVGLGGVGSIVARYIAVYLAALDLPLRLVLMDGDTFEESNATRQLFAYSGNKSEVIRDELIERFAGTALRIECIPLFVTPDNVDRLICEHDIILAAVDNHATRLLLTQRCSELDDIVFISGGNDGVGKPADGPPQRGTMGSVQVQLRRAGLDIAPPLTHYHPEIAEPIDKRPDEVSCTAALQSQPQLLFTNLTTASCILNTFMLQVSDALHYSELSFDIADAVMRPVLGLPGESAHKA